MRRWSPLRRRCSVGSSGPSASPGTRPRAVRPEGTPGGAPGPDPGSSIPGVRLRPAPGPEQLRRLRAARRLRSLAASMSSGLHALRLAARSLLRSPGVALACILALGLGIGATTAIFAFIDKLLLEPFAFPQDGLAMALESNPERDRRQVPPALAEAWASNAKTFTSMAAYEWWAVNLTGVTEPEHLSGSRVSPG